jgi:predicted ATPase
VPLTDRYAPLTLTPERQRQRTLETVLTVLRTLAARQPGLLIVEDLHWVDPSTLELLSLLVAQAATARLYVLLTWRPEFQPPWPPPAHLTGLTLGRLLPTQVEQLATHVAGGKALPAAVLAQIIAKTEGVPLFVEELTKMVLAAVWLREREDHYELTGPLPPLAIPPTVQDSIVARLEQLGGAKAVAQVGAVWGRGFTEAQIQAVAPLDRRHLAQALARLVEADIVQEVSIPPRVTYVFKHALIQEAAYALLPLDVRQQVHGQVAQALAEQFPATVETQPELLAQHYTAAGLPEPAIAYWQQAGQRASARSAYVEATHHLTQGLELLQTLPDSPKHTRQELTLQTALGVPLLATRGFAAPEVEKAYARARELCQQVGDAQQLFPVLCGLWGFYNVRGELQTARELGEQLLSLAQRQPDPMPLVLAHRALGDTLVWLGEVVSGRGHLEQSIALYVPQQHRALTVLAGEDPGVVCLSFIGWVLWFLGYPDQALQRNHEAIALARELSHPLSLTRALFWAARLHQLRREWQATQARVEEVIALSSEQGYAYRSAQGTLLQGWVLAEQGQRDEGIAQMRQGLTAFRATGGVLGLPHHLGLLAQAYGNVGQVEAGRSVLDEALAVVENTGERRWEAELYRLKGELLWQQTGSRRQQADMTSEAETCLRQALATARRQQGKSLELQAAMSLSRLWLQQGRRAEAHDLLAPVYGWFTEGFDTADLQEAKALLDALA